MAKYYGRVGYGIAVEDANKPGVFVDQIVKRPYYGDVIRNTRQLEKGEGVNDNVRVNNSISIVADAYANEHIFAMKFVEWMGSFWKITNVEVQRPRLILSIGGLYNGPTD